MKLKVKFNWSRLPAENVDKLQDEFVAWYNFYATESNNMLQKINGVYTMVYGEIKDETHYNMWVATWQNKICQAINSAKTSKFKYYVDADIVFHGKLPTGEDLYFTLSE